MSSDETNETPKGNKRGRKPKLDYARMWNTLEERLRGSLAFMAERPEEMARAVKAVLGQMAEIKDGRS